MALFLQIGISQLLRRNCLNLHVVFGIFSLQKAYCFVEIWKLHLTHLNAFTEDSKLTAKVKK